MWIQRIRYLTEAPLLCTYFEQVIQNLIPLFLWVVYKELWCSLKLHKQKMILNVTGSNIKFINILQMYIYLKGNVNYLERTDKIHQYTQQITVDILKNIFSSLLNQRHVTFLPSLYAYDCARICNEMLMRLDSSLDENLSLIIFVKLRSHF